MTREEIENILPKKMQRELYCNPDAGDIEACFNEDQNIQTYNKAREQFITALLKADIVNLPIQHELEDCLGKSNIDFNGKSPNWEWRKHMSKSILTFMKGESNASTS